MSSYRTWRRVGAAIGRVLAFLLFIATFYLAFLLLHLLTS